jgi:hypothetical protein
MKRAFFFRSSLFFAASQATGMFQLLPEQKEAAGERPAA